MPQLHIFLRFTDEYICSILYQIFPKMLQSIVNQVKAIHKMSSSAEVQQPKEEV